MKTKLLILFFALACCSCFGQIKIPGRIDSLKQALTLSQSDEDRVMILSDLSYEHLGSDTDSALLLAQQAHDLARKINFTRGEARALFHLGHTWRILSDIPKSMRASLRGVQLAEENGFRQEAALCNYNTGALYMDLLNDYPKALSYFKKARQWNSPVQGIIGESCRLTLDINFGNVYEHLDIPDSAVYYYNEALDHMAIAPDMRPVILNFKGLLQLKLKNYPEALALLREAISKKLSHRSSAEIYYNLASCFRDMGQTDSCLFYAQNSLAEAEQIGYQKYSMKAATLIAEIYVGENNPEALRYYKTAKLANDAVYGEQKVRDLQRIITEEMQRQQETEKERTAYQNRVRQLGLLGGLAVVLLVAFLLYRNNRQKQKSNARLEAQNRELEIEAALERVRSRAMAMHESAELGAVILTLFQQLAGLGIKIVTSWVTLMDTVRNELTIWVAHIEGEAKPGVVKNTDFETFRKEMEDWKSGKDNFLAIPSEIARSQVKKIFGFDLHPPDGAPFWHLCQSWNQYGYIGLSTWEPPGEEEKKIVGRFSKTFEQTYTRFLDIQKAEAQAREAQIEVALERVRARTMAMHKSEELLEVTSLLYSQLKLLGLPLWNCGIIRLSPDSYWAEMWTPRPDGQILQDSFKIPMDKVPVYKKMYDAWKRKELQHVEVLQGKEVAEHSSIVAALNAIPVDEMRRDASLPLPAQMIFHTFNFSGGSLGIIATDEIREPDLLDRFGATFRQTYTRFLDLQKAEAQARESEIQLALERVRARTMAMHKSDELREVTGVLFEQLVKLGFDIPFCGFVIYDKNTGDSTQLFSGFGSDVFPHSYHVPYFDHPYPNALLNAWKEGADITCFVWEGDLKKSVDDFFFEKTDFIKMPPEIQEAFKSIESILMYNAYMSYGSLEISSTKPISEDQQSILKRFARVFEQTYTRFLDIQKAEAQAREAQIEAALERVRSRAIAMRHSDELSEAAELLYSEFLKMGVESFSCGYLINDDERGEWKIWLTNPGEPFFKEFWTCPYFADHNLRARYESWKRQEEFDCAVLTGEENRAHHVVISQYAPWKEAMLDTTLPPQLVFNSAHFSLGHLLVISPDRLAPELEHAMVRFAKVFDLTYRRFLDLEKAEIRAREAKIDAGLDRVRAEIASMRNTEDLERITPLVWRELTTLEVPFFRCGVFIMDVKNKQVHTYLSTPDGKSLGLLQMPFNSAETIRKAVEHWRKQEIYLDNWNQQQFVDWVRSLTEHGYIQEGSIYQGAEQPPESLALHFVPFKQGMLYVGHSERLSEDQIQLVQRLADTFAVAYARYEDFTQLEAAKRQVETTLTELKSTQSQLIQSEKLASLGELTAGIAHEIQNPLNFVNNFSELSVDLANEINEEMDKEPIDKGFVKELMGDLTQNQEKINLHGKRAAAIVSGMLQHARASTGTKEPTDLNALADEYLRLSYHGLRAKDPTFNATMVTDFDPAVGKVEVIPQDMGRVLLNLINNAFYAVQQRERQGAARDLPGFQNLEGLYTPTVTVSTKKTDSQIVIKVKDNGTGIPEEVKAKIFQPFFTTKPTGQGTGLGLSLAYDIVVKGHGGHLAVESTEGEGTTFIVQLPSG